MPTVNWVLVADCSRARILHALPQGAKPWPILASFIHVESRLPACKRDAPGRLQRANGARSAVEPHEDRKHVEARRFAAELVELLERDRQDHRFDHLMVVAPPQFLGVLREAWPAPLQQRIVRELNQDLVGLEEPELQARLAKLLETATA
jgi:protein required for attachment to host cells